MCPTKVHVHTHTHTHTHCNGCDVLADSVYFVCVGVQTVFGPEWRRHALLILTHVDHLREAGLHLSDYLTQTSDWLRALAERVEGGVFFLDNSCDWPSIRGRPLRDRLLRLSARNHHRALTVRTEVSLWLWTFRRKSTLIFLFLRCAQNHITVVTSYKLYYWMPIRNDVNK